MVKLLFRGYTVIDDMQFITSPGIEDMLSDCLRIADDSLRTSDILLAEPFREDVMEWKIQITKLTDMPDMRKMISGCKHPTDWENWGIGIDKVNIPIIQRFLKYLKGFLRLI